MRVVTVLAAVVAAAVLLWLGASAGALAAYHYLTR